jgi:hypothetical protein
MRSKVLEFHGIFDLEVIFEVKRRIFRFSFAELFVNFLKSRFTTHQCMNAVAHAVS